MVSKSCPKCQDNIPVACKMCHCGYTFSKPVCERYTVLQSQNSDWHLRGGVPSSELLRRSARRRYTSQESFTFAVKGAHGSRFGSRPANQPRRKKSQSLTRNLSASRLNYNKTARLCGVGITASNKSTGTNLRKNLMFRSESVCRRSHYEQDPETDQHTQGIHHEQFVTTLREINRKLGKNMVF